MVKYEIKKKYLILYLCILIASGLLFICRCINYMDPSIKLLPDFLILHITNFSLSLMALLAFGFSVLVFNGKMKAITIAGILIIALNLIYELILPMQNKPDVIDVVSGLTGVALAYAFLLSLKNNGLISKATSKTDF